MISTKTRVRSVKRQTNEKTRNERRLREIEREKENEKESNNQENKKLRIFTCRYRFHSWLQQMKRRPIQSDLGE